MQLPRRPRSRPGLRACRGLSNWPGRRRRWDSLLRAGAPTRFRCRSCVGYSLCACGHFPELRSMVRLALEHGLVDRSSAESMLIGFIYHRAAQKDSGSPAAAPQTETRRLPMARSPASLHLKQRRSIIERPSFDRPAGRRVLAKPSSCFVRRCGQQALLFSTNRQTRFSIVQHPLDRKAVLTATDHRARQLGKLSQAIRQNASASTTETSSPSITGFTQTSASKPFFAIPIVPGKKAASKTPSGRLRRSAAPQN